MKKWRCTRCGYVHEGDEPPETCPICGAPREAFEPLEEAADATIEEEIIIAQEEAVPGAVASGAADADIIVVGSGAAAFAAAVTARHAGATVLMLEKADQVGGTTARSGGGYWVPGNRWQRQAGYEDDRQAALRYMARYSYPHLYSGDAERLGLPGREYELLAAYVDNAKEMAAHLDDIGALKAIVEINWTGKPQLDYMDHLPENGGVRGRSIYPMDKDGKLAYGNELIAQLEAWARGSGVPILTSCRATALVRDDSGRVTGVRAVLDGNKEKTFTAARGVIFGTGGYSQDAGLMLQLQRGPHYGGCAVPTNTGDFLHMAGAIGAQLANTAGAFRAQSMIEAALAAPGGSSNVFYLIGDSMLLVNKYGRRIFDEKRNYTDRTMLHFAWDPVRAEWTNMLTFLIFDERCAALWQGFPPFPVQGQDTPAYLIKADDLAGLQREIEARLEKLAPHTGGFALDDGFGEGLRATVERFNGFAKSGRDEDFGRGETGYDREWTTFPPTVPGAEWPPADSKNYTMYPLAGSGPYYAIILAAGTLDTSGGPATDGHARVLDWAGRPIPGLYGAGNCIASPTANAYWGAGSTIGPALTFGYIAARHALGL